VTGLHAFVPPGWRLGQVAIAGRENLDAQHMARYDAIEDAAADREVAPLQQWGMGPQSVVVELGTGTEQLALAAANVFHRVAAVDVPPVMIAELQDRLAREAISNVDAVPARCRDVFPNVLCRRRGPLWWRSVVALSHPSQ
jgi:tRNA G46 methylase TrmB